MGGCIPAVDAISDRSALTGSISLYNPLVPLGCDVIVLILRHLITKPVDVVLEDKVINLTCVTWIYRWQALFEPWWTLQFDKVLLLLLKFSIELVDNKLLVVTHLILLEDATAFCTQKYDISVFNLLIIFLEQTIMIIVFVLFIVDWQGLVSGGEVIWIELLVGH